MERINSQNSHEQQPEQEPRIQDLLPYYCEARNSKLDYEVIESRVVDGHEVAWLEYTGKYHDDREFKGRMLQCTCYFTQGVGWDVDDNGQVFNKYLGSDACAPKEEVIRRRKDELRAEYLGKYPDDESLYERIPDIVLDMIDKGKAGEWLSEGSTGANDWGGYFYLQTIQEITQVPYEDFWKKIDLMQYRKQITLNGMVVQEYRKPPEPKWEEYGAYEDQGWKCVAYLPAHDQMEQCWVFKLIAENGRLVAEWNPGLRLNYAPTFGVDAGDVAAAQQRMKEIVDQAIWNPQSMS